MLRHTMRKTLSSSNNWSRRRREETASVVATARSISVRFPQAGRAPCSSEATTWERTKRQQATPHRREIIIQTLTKHLNSFLPATRVILITETMLGWSWTGNRKSRFTKSSKQSQRSFWCRAIDNLWGVQLNSSWGGRVMLAAERRLCFHTFNQSEAQITPRTADWAEPPKIRPHPFTWSQSCFWSASGVFAGYPFHKEKIKNVFTAHTANPLD